MKTARLDLRRLAAADVETFHDLCRDAHVRRYLMDGQKLPRSWAEETIAASSRLFDTDGVGLYLVTRNGTPVGFCGYYRFPEQWPEPQLLYAFTDEHAGQGYATEVGRAMLAETERLGWSRVVAAVDRPNEASIRVLGKLGFSCCGRIPGHFGETLLYERCNGDAPPRLDVPIDHRFALRIASTWDGAPARPDEIVDMEIEVGETELAWQIDAPYHGDRTPESSGRLWEHEVVELMLLGDDDRYLEVELSPHGHHLVLLLAGARNVVHQGLSLDCRVGLDETQRRWRGRAHIPLLWLPERTRRLNAYAIHGDRERRYLAWRPVPGEGPDFHRLESFGRFDATDAL